MRTERTAIVAAGLAAALLVVGVRAGEPTGSRRSLERGQLNVGVAFAGGPFFLLGPIEWLGFQVDIEPRLARIQGERITRHLRLRISNGVFGPSQHPTTDPFPSYRTTVGILIADERSGSSVLPFFSLRGGVYLWPFRNPSGADGDIYLNVVPHFPIGGGIEVPRDGPVMFHFELGAVFPEALWFVIPDRYFGWLPVYFEIGAVFQPGRAAHRGD